MNRENFFCPLLNKDIANSLCLKITYAAEGRSPKEDVTDVANWEEAQQVCADCTNAYWNKNNLEPPEFVKALQD